MQPNDTTGNSDIDHQSEMVLCTNLYEYLEVVDVWGNRTEPACPVCTGICHLK